MLTGLSIRDIVLIERLDLELQAGLSVFTGETGAGKSILLDAMGLALGARADSGLIRKGAEQASVSATFHIEPGHSVQSLLLDQGVMVEDEVILRRLLTSDGRSRAFINDQPVSVNLLRRAGAALIEIVGQFEQQTLFDPAVHRAVLDMDGGLGGDLSRVTASYEYWQMTRQRKSEAEQTLFRAREEEGYLRHALQELIDIDPEMGEEEKLIEERRLLQFREKILSAIAALQEEISEGRGAGQLIASAQRRIDRLPESIAGYMTEVAQALERAANEVGEAVMALDRLARSIDPDPQRLQSVEDRLYLLRDLSRKHGLPVDELSALRGRFEEALSQIDTQSKALVKWTAEEENAAQTYRREANALSQKRRRAAAALDSKINQELPPLKLERASFVTRIEELPSAQWGPYGMDRVLFEASTIPGAPPDSLSRIASGGELSRFLLALKVVMSAGNPVTSLVFDEVDAGVGGATADAVGSRLLRLAERLQLLVITHSPQVAAAGQHHWQVRKVEREGQLFTELAALDSAGRREEIARMLSGAEISEEARAAARRLMQKGPALVIDNTLKRRKRVDT